MMMKKAVPILELNNVLRFSSELVLQSEGSDREQRVQHCIF